MHPVTYHRAAPEKSHVESLSYQPSTQRLQVTFRPSNAHHEYAGVPEHLWRELAASEHPGEILQRTIRIAYPSKKLGPHERWPA